MSKKSHNLHKSDNPEQYAKLANEGILLGYPVKIAGQHARPDNGIHYHSSIKFFDPAKDHPHAIHELAQHLPLNAPDAKNTQIEPGQFKDRFGNDVYVLKMKGNSADKIKEHNGKFAHMGFPATFEYTPHISVDKATWDKVKASGAKTAHEAGIEFGPAQLKKGPKVLKTYHHEPDSAEPKVPDQGDMTAKIGKSEIDLAKGSMQRIAPFRPQPKSGMNQMVHDWQDEAAPQNRPHLKQSKEAKIRALHRLHSNTSVRKNPKTGEREYLLHRGMGEKEKNAVVGGTHINHPEHSSWTPDSAVALDFAKEYSNKDKRVNRYKDMAEPHVASAWIPESKITHVPRQEGKLDRGFSGTDKGGKNAYSNEHEVIVAPHSSQIASQEEKNVAHTTYSKSGSRPQNTITSPRLNQRISARGALPDTNTRQSVNTVFAHQRKFDKSENIHGQKPLAKPYLSEAQRRWGHTPTGKKALGGEAGVHEWDEATKGKKLPERVKKNEDDGKQRYRIHEKGDPITLPQTIEEIKSTTGKFPKDIEKDPNFKVIPHYREVKRSESEIKSLIKKEHSLHSKFAKALSLTGDTLQKYIEDNRDLQKALEGK